MKNFVLAKDGLGNRYGLISLTDEQVFITPDFAKVKPLRQGIYSIDQLESNLVQVVGTLPNFKNVKYRTRMRDYASALRKEST